MPFESVAEKLEDTNRPTFLFGTVPPRDDTSIESAKAICALLASRSAVLATDGFIVYDIQQEEGRTTLARPFPFRRTMDPSLYASFFVPVCGKPCVVYKSVVESSMEAFDQWAERATKEHLHEAFNFVGASCSNSNFAGPTLAQAMVRAKSKGMSFGCVCIAERHIKKGSEHQNMLNKVSNGAKWFITQGVYEAAPSIALIRAYGDLCKANNVIPRKVVITFAPCGRKKTMLFIEWLGMQVSDETKERILSAANPVNESMEILCEVLKSILEGTAGSGVPIGINVESLSIFKEEIDAAHVLFQRLQALLLNSRGSPWAVRWFFVAPSLHKEEELVRSLFTSREQSVIKHILAHRNRLEYFGFDHLFVFGIGLGGLATYAITRYVASRTK